MQVDIIHYKPENVGVDGIVTRHADDLTADNFEHAHPFFPEIEKKMSFIPRPVK